MLRLVGQIESVGVVRLRVVRAARHMLRFSGLNTHCVSS